MVELVEVLTDLAFVFSALVCRVLEILMEENLPLVELLFPSVLLSPILLLMGAVELVNLAMTTLGDIGSVRLAVLIQRLRLSTRSKRPIPVMDWRLGLIPNLAGL